MSQLAGLLDKYDIIIASAVFDHIPDCSEIIKTLFTLLKKDGIFYSRTPFVVPLMVFINKFKINLDFTYPAHVHDMGDKFWNTFITKMGISGQYKIIKSRPSIVESSFNKDFIRTLISTTFKAIWYPFRFWKFVGGWEIFIKKVD